jgi:hypothetical protein
MVTITSEARASCPLSRERHAPATARAGCPRPSGRDARATKTVRHYILQSSVGPSRFREPTQTERSGPRLLIAPGRGVSVGFDISGLGNMIWRAG